MSFINYERLIADSKEGNGNVAELTYAAFQAAYEAGFKVKLWDQYSDVHLLLQDLIVEFSYFLKCSPLAYFLI